jgi:hypothetical protein
MKSVLAIATGVVFISLIATYVIPNGKLRSSINFVLRLTCILALISPVINIIFPDVKVDYVNYNQVASVFEKSQENYLQKLIFDKFGVDCECNLIIDYDGEKIIENGITIKIKDNFDKREQIYSYLLELGYINIIVNE